jgi:hypothetical protein
VNPHRRHRRRLTNKGPRRAHRHGRHTPATRREPCRSFCPVGRRQPARHAPKFVPPSSGERRGPGRNALCAGDKEADPGDPRLNQAWRAAACRGAHHGRVLAMAAGCKSTKGAPRTVGYVSVGTDITRSSATRNDGPERLPLGDRRRLANPAKP